MPPTEMPMNTAHQHAENAESFLASGLLIPASEQHFRAAEAYQAAAERSQDDQVKRTLRMLHNEHHKAGLELQRRIEKLREDGKDPNVPQKSETQTSGPREPSSQLHNNSLPPRQPSPSPRHMTDSQPNGVDESFMLLGGQRSDPGDAFNQFWNIMQGMLDNLSQPVAFATVPLGGDDIPPRTGTPPALARSEKASGHSQDAEQKGSSRFSWRRTMGLSSGSEARVTSAQTESPLVSDDGDDDFDEDFGEDLSESFYVIPGSSEPILPKLKKENAILKSELEVMKKRVEMAERVIQLRKEQDTHLRDSIFLATKEAQRALSGSVVLQRPGSGALDLGSLNHNMGATPLPIPGFNTAREAQYAKRVKELEDDLRATRQELDKTRADNLKLKERWAKVKESAKKKKESRIAAEAAKSTVQERIVEEPEEEEAQAQSHLS